MDKKKAPLAIALAFKDAPPSSVDAGATFSFSLTVAWPEGTDANGATCRVLNGAKTIASAALPAAAEDGSIPLSLTAPKEAGEHNLTLTVASVPDEKKEHAEGSLSFTLTTVPHMSSLAVWDTPSPVIRGTGFEIKVGAKCSSSCRLGGRTIEVIDESGKVVGSGTLKDEIVPDTASLYWTTVRVSGASELGQHEWSVRFKADGLELPHQGDDSRFSFIAVEEPEHSVAVKVVAKDTKAPVGGAQVRLGPYRAITGDDGSATVRVPKGKFPLVVTHVRYEMPVRTINVAKDVRVRIAGEKIPEEDPFAQWTA